MTKSASLFLVTLAGLSGSAFAGESDPTIASLKEEILSVARANTLNTTEELAATRAKLEPLVNQLVSLAGPLDVPTQLQKVEGAWYELWSDDREPEKPGAKLRRDTVYQVVTPAGYFYNLGTSEGQLPTGQKLTYTAFLRGVYTLDPARNGFRIQFTDIGFINGYPPAATPLRDLVSKAEADKGFLNKFPFDLKAPKGPINQTGFLTNIYVDEKVRIARGFADLDGREDLYVLERTDAPVVTD